MGVSISLLYPSLLSPELPAYYLLQLFQRCRFLYPWRSRLWAAKRLTLTTFRILFTVRATSGMQLCSLLDCIRSKPVEPPLESSNACMQSQSVMSVNRLCACFWRGYLYTSTWCIVHSAVTAWSKCSIKLAAQKWRAKHYL